MRTCRFGRPDVPARPVSRWAEDLVRALRDAWDAGDESVLRRLLHPRATFVVDSGGQVPAPVRPVRGSAGVAAAMRRAAADLTGAELAEVRVNGQPGLAFRDLGRVVAVIGIGLHGQRIRRVWMTVNPSKLTRWNRP